MTNEVLHSEGRYSKSTIVDNKPRQGHHNYVSLYNIRWRYTLQLRQLLRYRCKHQLIKKMLELDEDTLCGLPHLMTSMSCLIAVYAISLRNYVLYYCGIVFIYLLRPKWGCINGMRYLSHLSNNYDDGLTTLHRTILA